MFCDTRIETLSDKEVNLREHIVILGDMLEELLLDQDDLSPKESIREYESHLQMCYKEIKKRRENSESNDWHDGFSTRACLT